MKKEPCICVKTLSRKPAPDPTTLISFVNKKEVFPLHQIPVAYKALASKYIYAAAGGRVRTHNLFISDLTPTLCH